MTWGCVLESLWICVFVCPNLWGEPAILGCLVQLSVQLSASSKLQEIEMCIWSLKQGKTSVTFMREIIPLKQLATSEFSLSCVSMLHVGTCMCQGSQMGVRGQGWGVSSILLPQCGLDPDHQVFVARAYQHQAISQAQHCFYMSSQISFRSCS